VVFYLQRAKYDKVLEVFDGLSPAQISLLVEAVSSVIVQDELLDEWFDNSNGPALACLLRGAILLKRAWVYRGWGRGHEVSEDSFERMYKALGTSLRSLTPIMDDSIYGSEACARLIRVHKGLSADWDDIDAVHTQMRSFENCNMIGEVHYLIASCEKWLGSHDKMFKFAINSAAQYPEYPELGALVAAAHFDRHMYWDRFDENHEEAIRYRADPNILEEIIEFRDKLLSQYETDKEEHVLAHNIFAAVACEFEKFELATPSFMCIGQKVMAYPWAHFWEEELQSGYIKAMKFKDQYLQKGGYFDRSS